MFFYLAGSIEYSPDQGKGWRAELKPALAALGHGFYDPAEDEIKNLTETEVREFRSWRTTDLKRFRQTIQKIIAYDLDLIEHHCDAIVCYWDQFAGRGAGTQGELTFAHRIGIPVYLICGVPVEQISRWLLGCATEIFTSVEEFHTFMSQMPVATEIGSGVK
ncbi:MAG: nucleoside 2-deoxyribosyltransferase [Acidobacteriia bacterium]|nr:nucleoside 2-deoxyribosyltransferase [Terriglobia bacterium]